MSEQITIIAFYLFTDLENTPELKQRLFNLCEANGIRGTILLAREGINGTVAGPAAGIDALTTFFKNEPALSDLTWKTSYAEFIPFMRLKVRLKPHIVKLGVDGLDPRKSVGEYVKPDEWNNLINDPETIVIDTRNDYEYEIGTFKGAINPNTKAFCELPEYVSRELTEADKKKKVAMFCTGGIRCEKSTAYMKELGFEHVYHLEGGILNYLEKVPQEQSNWEGECFVFDDRVSVDHQLNPGNYTLCADCDAILSEEMRNSPYYEEGVCCPKCYELHYGPQETMHELASEHASQP